MKNITMTEALINAMQTLAASYKNRTNIYEQKFNSFRQGVVKNRESKYTPHQGKRECARRKRAIS
jgi:hypothetical protein